MSLHEELKRAAEAVMGMNYPWEHTVRDGRLGKTSTEYARLVHPSNVLGLIAENEKLKAECEGLRELFLSAAHGLCLPVEVDAQQVVDAITALQVRNAELRKHAPGTEITWCACGDGYPANSYGSGFMDANKGVCENCDAAKSATKEIICPLELFEGLRDSAAAESDDHRQCLASYRPQRQEVLDAVVRQCDELIAAMGKGERS